MKPYKLCKCGRYCESGYCSECRVKDDTRATIEAREVMDKAAGKAMKLSDIGNGINDFIQKFGDREINGVEYLQRNLIKYAPEIPKGFELISDGRKVIIRFNQGGDKV